MSFITLQSKRNETSPQALDSSYFRNDFKNGVYVKTGDTISLVNLTINTAAEFIVNNQNDTIVFRLGARTLYFTQVEATLEHGAFDGDQLAVNVENALNNAVVGGIWKRYNDGTTQYGFVCKYNATANPAKPTFTITMRQQIEPTVENLSDKIGYSTITNKVDDADPNSASLSTEMATTEVNVGNDNYYHIDGVFTTARQGSIDVEVGGYSAIEIGQRGMFLNGGANVMDCKPIKGIDTTSTAAALASFNNLYQGGGGGLTGDVWVAENNNSNLTPWLLDAGGSPASSVACNIITSTTSWDLKITFVNNILGAVGGGPQTEFFLSYRGCLSPSKENGAFVMGTDSTTDPDDPANWDAPIPYWWWDKTNSQLVGSTSQLAQKERFEINSPSDAITHIIKCGDPTKLITATLVDCAGYNAARVGFVRQEFFYGDKNIADQAINTSPTGTDFSIGIIPSSNSLIPKIEACKIVGKGGTKWGEPNWRDGTNSGQIDLGVGFGKTPLITDLIPSFQAGDRIKIGIEYFNLRSYVCFVMVAAATDPNNYLHRKNLVGVGSVASGVPPDSFVRFGNSPIKQSRFNIRPVSAYGGGGYYEHAHYVLKGKNDRAAYKDSGSLSTFVSEPEEDETLFVPVNTMPPNTPAGPSTTIISELNRNSGTDANNVSQTITIPAQYTGYDVNSISLYMNNADPSASFNIVLDLYANITDATSTQIATRFSGQTPFHTTEPVNIPPSGTAARTWDIDIDTSSYSVFHIVAREVNNGSMVNLGIQGDFSSNLGGTTANMVGGLKLEVVGNTPASSPVYLSALGAGAVTNYKILFKFGRVNSGELTNDAEMIPNIANTSDLLGFIHFIEDTTNNLQPAVATGEDFELVSTNKPEGNATDLNMMVCLEDFNITGKNGNTGDDIKIVAVIPKEQLTEGDSNKNILHYTADFPIPIDLNVATDQTYYSLTASLRDMDGKFIQSLESPTTITLLHERDKKSAMGDAIANAMDKAAERRANIQSSIITNAGLNNPRI